MRIVHLSDTHIGFTAYRALDPQSGLNQRESDINHAFSLAIDKILELEPQIVIHTGDLFDSVRPSNRSLTFAIRQLLRLSEANIPIVIICGNHSTPRLKDTGNVFQLFELFSNIYPVYEGYSKLSFGNLTIHAIPHCSSQQEFKRNLACIERDNNNYQILMLHAAIAGTAPDAGIPVFSMSEFNELEAPAEILNLPFSYLALGHFHKFTQIKENACYAGSIERLSFSEADQEKGLVEIDLKRRKINFHPLEIRPMNDLSPIDASGMDAANLIHKLEETLKNYEIKGKIFRLTIKNIPKSTYKALDFKHIQRLISDALHFEIRYQREEQTIAKPLETQKGNLISEFRDYLAQLGLKDEERKKLFQIGERLLKEAIGEVELVECSS